MRTAATRPPPLVLSLPDSSNTMMRSPSFWNVGFLISGSMLVCSQESAVESEQSCASSQPFGTIQEKLGKVPLAKSVANWGKETRLAELMLVM